MNKKEFYEIEAQNFMEWLGGATSKEIVERVYTKKEIAKMFKDFK